MGGHDLNADPQEMKHRTYYLSNGTIRVAGKLVTRCAEVRWRMFIAAALQHVLACCTPRLQTMNYCSRKRPACELASADRKPA